MPVGKNVLAEYVKDAGVASGVKGKITSHSTRRGAATTFVSRGGSTEGLMQIGGWHSSKIARGYVETSEQTARENAAILAPPPSGKQPHFEQNHGLVPSGNTTGTYILQNCTGVTMNFMVPQPNPSLDEKEK